MKSTAQKEQFALKVSMYGTLFFVVLGLGFALVTGSGAILFDGIYSLIVFSIALLTIKVAQLAERPDDEKFHFGYTQLEPLINVTKALFVLSACIYAIITAIDNFGSGGNQFDYDIAAIYGFIAAVGCLSISYYLKQQAKTLNSSLVKVDAAEWLVDGMLSTAVMVGFVIAYFIQSTSYAGFVPYIDPLLVIILTTLALPIPGKILYENMLEVIQKAPANFEDFGQQLKLATEELALDEMEYRVLKKGRNTYLLVHLIVSKEFKVTDIKELDDIRAKVDAHMKAFCSEVVMDILFIKDPKWAD